MAKKARTPPPPRKVQAPKVRTGKPAGGPPADERRRRLILYALGASGFVGLVLAVIVIFLAGRSGGGAPSTTKVAQTMAAAGCTFKSYPGTSRRHVRSLTAKIKYNSFPPTNGPHYQFPAIWNFYDSPLVEIQAVHNLEHGGIVIQWGSKVPASDVEKLRTFWGESPNAMLLAPLPKLGNKIALAAWNAPPNHVGQGRLALCTSFSRKAFTTFRDAYRGKGPERFPVSALTPGS